MVKYALFAFNLKKVTSDRIFSSEGALIAITPYDYPQGKPLFEHTPALDNNLNIIAMMTLVTIISMINKITKITRNIK